MSRAAGIPAAIAASGLITAFLVATDAAGPARIAVTLSFLLCGPGLAWVRLLRLPEPATEWTIAVVASIGIDVAVANALLTTGLWTPGRAIGTIVVVAIAGSMVEAGLAILSSSKIGPRPSTRWDPARRDRFSNPCPQSGLGTTPMVAPLPVLGDQHGGDELQHHGSAKRRHRRGRGQRLADGKALDVVEGDRRENVWSRFRKSPPVSKK